MGERRKRYRYFDGEMSFAGNCKRYDDEFLKLKVEEDTSRYFRLDR